jgi:hypothetical protein
MREQLISYNTAVLAKEKGFPQKQYYIYVISKNKRKKPYLTDINACHFSPERTYYSSTQTLLSKWLREKHDIIIEIQFDTITFGYRIFNPFKVSDYFTDWKYDKWSYEEALEEGLYQGLLLIK